MDVGSKVDTGFKNELAGKVKVQANPWNFDAPPYDQRSSCYINAGTKHGVGKKQPVGSLAHKSASVIPVGRVKTLETYEDS